jgi:predicted MFS family arabinose efflux permease
MSHYTEEERRLLSPRYRAVFVGVMFLVCLFDFADRTVFQVSAQSIKQEFGLSDTQLGLLSGIWFAFLYSIVGLPIGLLAERTSRVRIVAVCTALWSIATFWCGLAWSFGTLAVGRLGVGFGEAGFMGPANSLNSDLYRADQRASRMSLIFLGTPIGTYVGASLGGWAAQAFNWRVGFFMLGVGGILTAALALLFLRESPRGLADDLPKPAPVKVKLGPMLADFTNFLSLVWRKKSLLFVIAGYSFASIGMTSISNFLNPFLQRVHHLGPRDAGALFGMISAAALAIGLIVGSFGSDLLSKTDRRWATWAPAIGLLCAPVLYIVSFNTENIGVATLLLVTSGAVLLLYYGPTAALVQNLVEPGMRATAAAFASMLYGLVGYGVGPVVVGFLSDRIAEGSFVNGSFAASCPGGVAPKGSPEALAAACRAASAQGVHDALSLIMCIFFVAAACYLLASLTVRADLFRTEEEAEVAAKARPAPKPSPAE